MIDHKDRIRWDSNGEAKYLIYETVTCAVCNGEPQWDDGIGNRFCSPCVGKGTTTVTHYIRIPEFDAPQVPTDWKPVWAREDSHE